MMAALQAKERPEAEQPEVTEHLHFHLNISDLQKVSQDISVRDFKICYGTHNPSSNILGDMQAHKTLEQVNKQAVHHGVEHQS